MQLIWCSRIMSYYYQENDMFFFFFLNVLPNVFGICGYRFFWILDFSWDSFSGFLWLSLWLLPSYYIYYIYIHYMVLPGSLKLSHTCTHVSSVCEVKAFRRGSSKETYNSILTEHIFPGGFLSVNSDYRTFKSCSALFNYRHPHP